ncbi:TIGR02186 family protein [Pseudodesulfovibrio sp.]|uniref:TIGR02186 family protein n=1 Tax=Pseudodesulfovibrio sp. TaxID=2035812 RepID=UPI00262F7B12|nr:TIGR02186 family protein [Pseudodesulfovibrio sp.]MDD3311425.1 TIGR02186 family protein [Pseudodesulfovibrio sp.]
MNKIATTCLLGLAALLLAASLALAAGTDLTIRPNLVTIGTSFNGAQLTVTGHVPEGDSAVIRLMGEPQHRTFRQKGKALGVLWMNLKTVELRGVPDVFLMGTDGVAQVNWEHSDLGFQSIKGDADDLIFDEFIKLMERDGFYEVENGVVAYEPADNGERPFKATLAIPSAMHQGVYRVEVLAVKDGRVADVAARELHTRLTGLPEFLSAFAFDHSLLYGVAAVIIAILAGLAMSLIFKERGGVH